MLFIVFLIGILTVVLGTLNMGGEVNTGQQNFNNVVNYIFGFPMVLFKDGFPLLLSKNDFWSFSNLVLLTTNTCIQACSLYFIGKLINNKKKLS